MIRRLPTMQETWVQSLGWEDPLEKGKATHSSILAQRNPWTISESHSSSKFQSHFWTSLVAQTVKRLSTIRRPGFDLWVGKIPWRRKWQYTPVLLPGKSHAQRSLVGYSPWGCKELDMTERLHFHFLSLYQIHGFSIP